MVNAGYRRNDRWVWELNLRRNLKEDEVENCWPCWKEHILNMKDWIPVWDSAGSGVFTVNGGYKDFNVGSLEKWKFYKGV